MIGSRLAAAVAALLAATGLAISPAVVVGTSASIASGHVVPNTTVIEY